MKKIELKVPGFFKPILELIFTLIELSIKGMLSLAKFTGILISVTVLILAVFIFGVNGVMMSVGKLVSNIDADLYYQIVGNNLPLIHTLGGISLIISISIFCFLFYLYIKNVTED